MRKLLIYLPWFFVALFGTEIVAILAPKKEGPLHVAAFGKLPALLEGRIQPIDSVALNSLRQIRSTGDVPLEEVPSWKFWHHPKKLKSTEWLLEVMCRPEQADERPIFLIHHPELLGELKLTDKGVKRSLLRYYTYNELKPIRDELAQRAGQIQKNQKDQKLWSTVEKQTVKAATAVITYERLKNSLRPESSDDFAAELNSFYQTASNGVTAFRKKEAGDQFDQSALDSFLEPLNSYLLVANAALPLLVPPLHPEHARDAWVNIGAAILDTVRGAERHPVVDWYAKMATAYRQNQPAEFNAAVNHYNDWLKKDFAKEQRKGRAEFFYNDTKLFLHAMIIYLCAFFLVCAALLSSSLSPSWSESLRRSAFYLMILAGIVHTSGLIFRMALEGRPPVTNLYSSAIFIGWGALIFGIFLERIYRLGLGIAVGTLAGFVTLIIAHNLAIIQGDTMIMLQAVLDTNFWLATHVVVVTLGYASTFVAGLLGIAYVVLGLSTRVLSHDLDASGGSSASNVGKALSKMAYAIVCFATLFSFVGTILGGIWADQSWGRFWGWDPKENGALIIVIWNALILHARWGGLVRERGLMNMTIFGNIMTSFSWFGVNLLGIGLHAYGFMEGAFTWLAIFVASQVLLICLGLIPQRYWLSFRERKPVDGIGGGTPEPAR